MALLVSVIVRSEFDESTYDFKLPDVTTVADGSRLQDMILDLRYAYALTYAKATCAHLRNGVEYSHVEFARKIGLNVRACVCVV